MRLKFAIPEESVVLLSHSCVGSSWVRSTEVYTLTTAPEAVLLAVAELALLLISTCTATSSQARPAQTGQHPTVETHRRPTGCNHAQTPARPLSACRPLCDLHMKERFGMTMLCGIDMTVMCGTHRGLHHRCTCRHLPRHHSGNGGWEVQLLVCTVQMSHDRWLACMASCACS